MSKSISKEKYYHEIGHAIILYLFHSELFLFSGILLNPKDVKAKGLHKDDLFYTHVSLHNSFFNTYQTNPQLCNTIVGMLLLGGIAGQNYLCSLPNVIFDNIDENNFMTALNVSGSKGDFDIIYSNKTTYSNFIQRELCSNVNVMSYHAKLMNILKEIYLKDELIKVSNEIYDLMQLNPTTNITFSDFDNKFPNQLANIIKSEIINMISEKEIGKFH